MPSSSLVEVEVEVGVGVEVGVVGSMLGLLPSSVPVGQFQLSPI